MEGTEGSSNRSFDSKYTSFQVFSIEEEKILNDYIIKCCKMHYGLKTIQTRKLAYEYAKSLNLKYPANWEETKMAGKEWMYGFRRRNPELSLRKPGNTSAARSFAFNKTSVTEFYTNLKTVLERHPLTADRIFNFDESCVSTVIATPKVLAPRCQKQVGQIVSAERGQLVTFGGIISASGNTIPPLFVFPRVQYKDNFLEEHPKEVSALQIKVAGSIAIYSSLFLNISISIHSAQKITPYYCCVTIMKAIFLSKASTTPKKMV